MNAAIRTSTDTIAEGKDRSAISIGCTCCIGAIPDAVSKVDVLAQAGDV